MQPTLTLETLTIRAHELAEELAHFIHFAREGYRNDPQRMHRAPILIAKVHALEVALTLAEDDDVLTIANELTDLEDLANAMLPREVATVRPPPKLSGTFVVEVRTASTNRLLAVTET